MKAFVNQYLVHNVTITLNGKNMVESGHCFGADDETGQVLMAYQNATGAEVPVEDAEMNALIFDNRQVIVLKGKVEITVDQVAVDCFGFESKEAMLSAIDKTYQPIQITKKVQAGPCRIEHCQQTHWRLEPAFEF